MLHRHDTNHTRTQQANPAQAAQAYGAMTAAIVCVCVYIYTYIVCIHIRILCIHIHILRVYVTQT